MFSSELKERAIRLSFDKCLCFLSHASVCVHGLSSRTTKTINGTDWDWVRSVYKNAVFFSDRLSVCGCINNVSASACCGWISQNLSRTSPGHDRMVYSRKGWEASLCWRFWSSVLLVWISSQGPQGSSEPKAIYIIVYSMGQHCLQYWESLFRIMRTKK